MMWDEHLTNNKGKDREREKEDRTEFVHVHGQQHPVFSVVDNNERQVEMHLNIEQWK